MQIYKARDAFEDYYKNKATDHPVHAIQVCNSGGGLACADTHSDVAISQPRATTEEDFQMGALQTTDLLFVLLSWCVHTA